MCMKYGAGQLGLSYWSLTLPILFVFSSISINELLECLEFEIIIQIFSAIKPLIALSDKSGLIQGLRLPLSKPHIDDIVNQKTNSIPSFVTSNI